MYTASSNLHQSFLIFSGWIGLTYQAAPKEERSTVQLRSEQPISYTFAHFAVCDLHCELEWTEALSRALSDKMKVKPLDQNSGFFTSE